MKRLFSILVLAGLTMLMACGDEESDPQPVKTDLQLIQERIVGYWDLERIIVEKDGQTEMYTGESCDESSFSPWAQANIGNVDYDIKSTTGGELHIKCSNDVSDFTYTVIEKNGEFTISLSDGRVYHLLTDVQDLSKDEITLKVIAPISGGATGATRTFKRK